jgi:hypothetical protein
VLLAALQAACVSQPDTYAPPAQRKPLNVEDPSPLKAFVNMSDADAKLHFVKDISDSLEGGVWRWTKKSPTLMLTVPNTSGWKFAADLTIHELTFKDTGPVTITITVNGHELTKQHYDKPGPEHVEQPVPPEWLRAKAENLVTLEIDEVWIAPEDKAVLGFVLTRAGFFR